MRISQENPTSLTLKDNNYIGLIIGTTFVVVSLFLLFTTEVLRAPFDFKKLLPSGIFLILGIVTVLTNKFTTIILDKNQNEASIKSIGVLGKKHNEILLNSIARVELKQEYKMESTNTGANIRGFSVGSRIPRLYYQLAFVLNNGQEIQLDNPKSGLSIGIGGNIMGGREKERETGKKIAIFLNIPFQEISPTSFNPPIIPPIANPMPTVNQ